MIRIMIVDDQALVREGLKVILSADPEIEVVAVAADGAEALDMAARHQPDMMLMDLKMPVMNGVRATQLLKERFPHIRILILTTYDDDDWVMDAIRAGADAYLLKDSSREELIAAIVGTAAGRSHLDPAIAAKVMQAARYGARSGTSLDADLTERETEILRLLANGLSNAAIGERLSLAEGTVRNHVTSIFAKLDVSDRAQATAVAWRYGLMRPGDESDS